ncbi:Hypothetical predicted protein [Mytilus galloprovincialis]|uniref:WSC domain-containing protein n=1 Tax=Mytilus galloprovincialis TaxID=29158 RepID=A0A8B6ERD1_MYTGA|nr:Hypothetical predicted protein [Mytilus galloprovincialis]
MDFEREGLDYTYAGCYGGYKSTRFFRYFYTNSSLNMSPFVCMRHCQTRLSSQQFGITSGDKCGCRDEYYIQFWNRFDKYRPVKLDDTECDIYCLSDTVNTCGGNFTFSVYNIVTNITESPVPPSNSVTPFPERNSNYVGGIAGVAVGLTLLLMLAILVVLIRKRSKSNAKRSVQSCSNTNESVRYDNVPQPTPGVNGSYATLTVASDCQTYDDLMPTEGTYENTTTIATNFKESTQDRKRKQRKKKRTN